MQRCVVDDLLGVKYGIRGIKVNGGWQNCELTMDEIEELKTPLLYMAFSVYNNYNTFECLPHGKGTLAERPTITQIISILKQEENAWDRWESEKNR